MVTVSVIVPAWNAAACLPKLLAAIEAQTTDRNRFELLIVDNGSSDDTAAIAGGCHHATLLKEPSPGSYAARNKAIGQAKGEFLLFTDADCVPSPDWIERAIAVAVAGDERTIHAGQIRLFSSGPRNAVVIYEELKAFNQKANVAAGYAVTANLLCHRSAFAKLGPFRADVLSGGDYEFTRRAVERGYRLSYAPSVIVGHPTRARLSDLIAKKRRIEGGHWIMREKRPLELLRKIRGQWAQFRLDRRLIRQADLSAATHAKTLLVSGVVCCAATIELLRLQLKGRPYRS